MIRFILPAILLAAGLSASAQGFAPIKLTYLNPADGKITLIKTLMFASDQIIVSDPDGVEVGQTGRVISPRVILTTLVPQDSLTDPQVEFSRTGPIASVRITGEVTASSHAIIAGNEVINEGLVGGGNLFLATGDAFTWNPTQPFQFYTNEPAAQMPAPLGGTPLINDGSIETYGGLVRLQTVVEPGYEGELVRAGGDLRDMSSGASFTIDGRGDGSVYVDGASIQASTGYLVLRGRRMYVTQNNTLTVPDANITIGGMTRNGIAYADADLASLELPMKGADINAFVEYHRGDLPFILGSPHGGHKTPTYMTDRTSTAFYADYGSCFSNVVTSPDLYTDELARELADELESHTGDRPHLVILNLARIKLDANREAYEAAMDQSDALAVYEDYHDRMQYARNVVSTEFAGQGGLFLDLHAISYNGNGIEWGAAVINSCINATRDPITNQSTCMDGPSTSHRRRSSLYGLFQTSLATAGSMTDTYTGDDSLGGLLADMNPTDWAGTPTPDNPYPVYPAGDPKIKTGGYILKKYGTREAGYGQIIDTCDPDGPGGLTPIDIEKSPNGQGGIVDGIQLELPRLLRTSINDTYGGQPGKREYLAADLAAAMIDFMSIHHGLAL